MRGANLLTMASLAATAAAVSPSAGRLLTGHTFGSPLWMRRMVASDLPVVSEMELASYPSDESASPEKLAWRLENAPEYFYGVYTESSEVVGFIVGTCTAEPTLTDESMDGHDPHGANLCIHSVVTGAACRRKRVATAALRAYVASVVEEDAAREAAASGEGSGAPYVPLGRIMLIAKAGLLRLYIGAGFDLVGLSEVVHGADPWFELAMALTKEPLSSARAMPFVQVGSVKACSSSETNESACSIGHI